MPTITVYMNCDTRLAINLSAFNLNEYDEFIFVIKNYSYIESSYVFLYKARVSDMDANGEVFVRIPPTTSKHIKPGAFYNFAVMKNAFSTSEPTEYRKLTDNGSVFIEYGAQDFLPKSDCVDEESEIISIRLELVDDTSDLAFNKFMSEITNVRFELLE
jgi:hypothetical protein